LLAGLGARQGRPPDQASCRPEDLENGYRRDKIRLAVVAAESTENEVLAQELESLGGRVHAVEERLADVERVIAGLEAAARTTARALEEVSSHWASVYRAMRRAE
jgi:hypothetical protein